jgi:hypothetical protein
MTRKALSLMAAIASALIAGCSTTPVPSSSAAAVPAERLLPAANQQPVAGGGSISVTRDSGMMGAACSVRVWIDGVPVADIRTAERVRVNVTAGDHIVSAQPNAICAGGLVEVAASVKPGRDSRFRIGAGHNGEVILVPTAF